ncbi:MAG: hypothetical protein IPF66_22455 [Holophagales bacterium]|nr:hypothetical protein [Holophagales bacterium]
MPALVGPVFLVARKEKVVERERPGKGLSRDRPDPGIRDPDRLVEQADRLLLVAAHDAERLAEEEHHRQVVVRDVGT